VKEKIGRLARGIVDGLGPKPTCDPESIDETIEYGRVNSGSLRIYNEEQQYLRGLIYSTNPRVMPEENSFAGNSPHIIYTVDPAKLCDGDRIEGSFSIVTNDGEFSVPYCYTVQVTGATTEESQSTAPETYVPSYTSISPESKEIKTYARTPEQTKARHYVNYKRAQINYLLRSGAASLTSMNKELAAYLGKSEPTFHDMLSMLEVLVFQGKKEKAEELISEIERVRGNVHSDIEGYAYFRYLMYMNGKDWKRKESLLELLANFSDTRRSSPILFIIRLAVDEGLSGRPLDCLGRLQDYYDSGFHSPYLYLESCRIMNRIPDTLRELTDFEINSLYFGARHDFISEELLWRISQVISERTPYDERIYLALKLCYEHHQNPQLLTTICRLLINGGKTDTRFFSWFEAGVNADIKLQGIFESYLAAMPRRAVIDIPKEVMQYFSYNAPTTFKGKCILYRAVLESQSPNSNIYASYSDSIKAFAREQIIKGHIDENLAAIYRKLLKPSLIDEQLALQLPALLLSYELEVNDPRLVRMIVRYHELDGHQVIDTEGGHAVFPLYSKNYEILFEDEQGKQYSDVPVKITALIPERDSLLAACARLVPELPLIKITYAGTLLERDSLSNQQALALKSLADSEGISAEYKSEIIDAIISKRNWGTTHDDAALAAGLTDELSLSTETNNKLIDALVKLKKYELAFKCIPKYDYDKVSPESLKSAISAATSDDRRAATDKLSFIANYLFRHELFDKNILGYLCKNYNGLAEDMTEILFAANKAGAKLYDAPERLLAQKLFADDDKNLDEIFFIYLKNCEVDKRVLYAYYVKRCHSFFINDVALTDELAEAITKVVIRELSMSTVPVIISLALTYYYSHSIELSGDQKLLCTKMIESLSRRNIFLPYFKKFASFIELPEEVLDKTIIAYKGKETDSVTLICYSENDDEEPIYLEMNHIYGGVFVRPVLLFAGEKMTYEIRVGGGEDGKIATEGTLSADITATNENRKFLQLNDLISGSSSPEDVQWQKNLQKYIATGALTENLFVIEDK